jgi:hypothetical protein
MLEEVSKLEAAGKYGGVRVYIPSDLVSDSQFPFKVGEKVEVKIDPDKKIIILSSDKR